MPQVAPAAEERELDPPRRPPRLSLRGVLVVLLLLGATAFAAQSCQQGQIRISKERAIELATPEAGFTPARTQVRLVRQGLTGHPFWAVSLSIAARDGDGYDRLTTVRVDAHTGTIAAVNRER